jgi:hypothetical protein
MRVMNRMVVETQTSTSSPPFSVCTNEPLLQELNVVKYIYCIENRSKPMQAFIELYMVQNTYSTKNSLLSSVYTSTQSKRSSNDESMEILIFIKVHVMTTDATNNENKNRTQHTKNYKRKKIVKKSYGTTKNMQESSDTLICINSKILLDRTQRRNDIKQHS